MGDAVAKRLLIVTGEASGDLHGARLVEALRRIGPVEVSGVAGPRLRSAGVRCWVPAESLAVVGFAEIIAKLPRLIATRRTLLRAVERDLPDAVVLVDYPGFNLRIGPELKARGARIFYYIAPQVWAWHPERARAMARWVDELAVVFPFEESIFRDAGVPTTYVGHPLLDDLAPEVDERTLRAELEIGPDRRVVGLLPGSRGAEVRAHGRDMLLAARRLAIERRDLAIVVALADGESAPPGGGVADARTRARWFAAIGMDDPAAGAAHPADMTLRLAVGRTRAVQRWATACAVASGTATLETALFGTPLVIVYRTSGLTYRLARHLIRLSHIGLPNIVAGEPVAPELLQDQFTPERLAETLARWLDDPVERARASDRLARVRQKLGGPGASARAAARLWDLLS